MKNNISFSTPEHRRYAGKMLLFGEHVLLLGATALATPVAAFSGGWAQAAEAEHIPHHQALLDFARSPALDGIIDTARFLEDLDKGLYFDSSIPQGYGLGSSGALCAAVLDQYGLDKPHDPAALKAIFVRMESYFHGNSSGIDPLTSYLNQPVVIRHRTEVTPVQLPEPGADSPVVFLVDTGLPRQTGPLVQWFLAQSETPVFRQWLEATYLPAHECVVAQWLAGRRELFWENLAILSEGQFTRFIPMIPASVREIWEKNIGNTEVLFKICGAGGGGYLLGFARNRQAVYQAGITLPVIFL